MRQAGRRSRPRIRRNSVEARRGSSRREGIAQSRSPFAARTAATARRWLEVTSPRRIAACKLRHASRAAPIRCASAAKEARIPPIFASRRFRARRYSRHRPVAWRATRSPATSKRSHGRGASTPWHPPAGVCRLAPALNATRRSRRVARRSAKGTERWWRGGLDRPHRSASDVVDDELVGVFKDTGRLVPVGVGKVEAKPDPSPVAHIRRNEVPCRVAGD